MLDHPGENQGEQYHSGKYAERPYKMLHNLNLFRLWPQLRSLARQSTSGICNPGWLGQAALHRNATTELANKRYRGARIVLVDHSASTSPANWSLDIGDWSIVIPWEFLPVLSIPGSAQKVMLGVK
ncbi:MAG: hypothetical protein ABI977_24235 [Acidobacteriota bacterium]